MLRSAAPFLNRTNPLPLLPEEAEGFLLKNFDRLKPFAPIRRVIEKMIFTSAEF
jgi:hypothetical protein